jgi:hypothetical protein
MRPYTGFDKISRGRRPGLERLVQYIVFLSENKCWNNGTWGVREKRGKTQMSVHATGRAADISWRKMPDGRGSNDWWDAARMMQFLVDNADALGLEMVIDYCPQPFGRAWRCDRNVWRNYLRRTVQGAPGGDWFHLEVSNQFADDAAHYDRVFQQIFGGG